MESEKSYFYTVNLVHSLILYDRLYFPILYDRLYYPMFSADFQVGCIFISMETFLSGQNFEDYF